MKKKILGKKLSRSRTARLALYRSQIRALFQHGKIETTLAKAKSSQRFINKIVGDALGNSLAKRRMVLGRLGNDRITMGQIFKILENSKRSSGFTRIIRLPGRKGDNADMARLELVDKLPSEKEKESKGKAEKKIEKKDGRKKKS